MGTLSIGKRREKGETRNKVSDRANDKKQTLPLIDGLSRNYSCHFQEIKLDFATVKTIKQWRPRLGGVWESIVLYKPTSG